MNTCSKFKFSFALLLPFALLLLPIGSTASAAAPANSTGRTVAFVNLLANRNEQAAVAQFDDRMKNGLPADKLEAVWRDLTGKLGAFKNTGETKTVAAQGYTVVYVESVFARGAVWVQVDYDKDDKIAGLHFLPTSPSQM